MFKLYNHIYFLYVEVHKHQIKNWYNEKHLKVLNDNLTCLDYE